MKRSELEAALGTRVRFEVPYDDGVPAAVGLGKPIVLSRSGGFARAVTKIAGELVPTRSRSGAGRSPPSRRTATARRSAAGR